MFHRRKRSSSTLDPSFNYLHRKTIENRRKIVDFLLISQNFRLRRFLHLFGFAARPETSNMRPIGRAAILVTLQWYCSQSVDSPVVRGAFPLTSIHELNNPYIMWSNKTTHPHTVADYSFIVCIFFKCCRAAMPTNFR